MKSVYFISLLCLLALSCTACSDDKEPEVKLDPGQTKVCICKLNGDYAGCPTVIVDKSGSTIYILSTTGSIHKPTELSDGFYTLGYAWQWGIDRVTFLNMTYEEYDSYFDDSNYQQIPNFDKILLDKAIPEAKITEMYRLPFYDGDYKGEELIKRCNDLISKGLPGCELIYEAQ